jgi:hypothetical protein
MGRFFIAFLLTATAVFAFDAALDRRASKKRLSSASRGSNRFASGFTSRTASLSDGLR